MSWKNHRSNWRSNYCSRHNIFRQLIWYFFSSDLDETFKYCCLHYFNKVLMTKYEILSYHAFEFYLRGFLCFWNHQSKTFPKLCVTTISLDWKLDRVDMSKSRFFEFRKIVWGIDSWGFFRFNDYFISAQSLRMPDLSTSKVGRHHFKSPPE